MSQRLFIYCSARRELISRDKRTKGANYLHIGYSSLYHCIEVLKKLKDFKTGKIGKGKMSRLMKRSNRSKTKNLLFSFNNTDPCLSRVPNTQSVFKIVVQVEQG